MEGIRNPLESYVRSQPNLWPGGVADLQCVRGSMHGRFQGNCEDDFPLFASGNGGANTSSAIVYVCHLYILSSFRTTSFRDHFFLITCRQTDPA